MKTGGAVLDEVLNVGNTSTSSVHQRLMLRVAAPRLNAISGVLKEASEVSGQERPLAEELEEAAGEVLRGALLRGWTEEQATALAGNLHSHSTWLADDREPSPRPLPSHRSARAMEHSDTRME